ncbi:MAG: winged helix DNA-binding domain-containing protein [Propionibacteriaceae bacterium]|jgi:uncharacterized protein YcaQ|nr:winged helix DNA-binding domain-containing protein [Propionibacteriaceae bacterium]
MSGDRLSLAQARRLALGAQGLARPRPAQPSYRDVTRVVDRLGLVQIDSVNIVERAHLLPFFSRLGPFDRGLFDRALERRRVLETWAHEASFVRPDVYHLVEWRRRDVARYAWGSMRRAATDHADVVARVRDLVTEHGPVTASVIQTFFEATHPRRKTGWGWNWSVAKAALEYLFFTGELASAGRTAGFERRYDLAERVVPPAPPGLPEDDAGRYRALTALAARAQGVATAADLADYFRVRLPAVRTAIRELVEAGELVPATVEGWKRPAWRCVGAVVPRTVAARALVVAFDPVVFTRPRVEALFGVKFRLEYYVPREQRVWGYFVMPFLLGDHVAARVDLKADRAASRLVVQAAYVEPGEDERHVAAELGAELADLATWLGLSEVSWNGRWTQRPDSSDT